MERMRDTMNPSLERIQTQLLSKLEARFHEAGRRMVERGKALASQRLKKPGTFLENFWFSVTRAGNDLILKFGNYHHASLYLEKGTRPHVISPKPGKPIIFFKEGRFVKVSYPKQIMHPGNPAYWIIRDAFQEVLRRLKVEISLALEEAGK